MTLDELLATARIIQQGRATLAPFLGKFADGVLDLLAESAPCGWEAPWLLAKGPIESDGRKVSIPQSWADTNLEPEEARACARMLLEAADAAEKEAP